MLYDLSLLLTALLYGWIAGDLLFARGRRRFPGVGLAAISIGLWCVGEFLVRHANGPTELVEARRVLFVGICALGPAWFWGAAQATRAPWLRERPWIAILAAVPGALAYGSLYTGSTLFLDTTTMPLSRGPLFGPHAVFSWLLVFLGFAAYTRHLSHLGSGTPLRLAMIAAAGAPFLANVVYVVAGFPPIDPTPIVLGAVALALRFMLFDTGIAPNVQTFAHREVVDQLGLGLILADAYGEIVEANPAAREIAGTDDLVGRPLREVIARARSHPLRIVEVEMTALERAGVRFGTAALLEDRTEVRTAERRLEIATRFEALGFLISGVAHEINNPLAYVRGNLGLIAGLVEAIQDHPELVAALPGPARRVAREGTTIVGDAIEGVDRIAALVRRLGTFARDDVRGPRSEVDVALVTRRAMEMASLGQASDLIRITHEDELPTVLAREEDIVQVLLHLLINAIQAGGKGSPIDLEMRVDGDHVAISVLDRGPGIPQDVLPYVFDAFFTTKTTEANQGLGLSLSYDLARQNGGQLEAGQRVGGGAVFSLYLPVFEGSPGEEDPDTLSL